MASGKKGKSVLGDVLTYGFASVATRVLSFLLIPLYTRFLVPADYGILDIVNQIGLVVGNVLMLNGIGMATMTFYLQAKSDILKKQVVSSLVMAMSTGVCIAAALLMPFSSPLVRILDLPCSSWIFALGCVTVLGEVLPVVPYTLMQARLESRRFMFWNLSTLIVRLMATILVVAVFHWGVAGVLLVRAGTSITTGSILLFRESKRNWTHPNREIIRDILRFTFPFLPTGVFAMMRDGAQRFLLLANAGSAELGIYALGATLTSVVGTVMILPFHKVWNAKMYGVYESENAPKEVGAVATKFVFLYLCGALPLVCFGKAFLRVISSADYGRAHLVFIPLLVVGVIDTFANIPDQVFFVHHKTKYKPFITGIVALFSLGIYFVVVPKFGILGAAYGLAVTSVIRVGIILLVSRRVFPIQFEIGKLSQLLALSLLFGYLGTIIPDSWLGLAAKAGLLLVMAALVFWFGIIPRSDYLAVLGFVRSTVNSLPWRRSRQ